MDRASAAVKAERLNHARELLQRFDHLPDAVAQMVQDRGVSPRQAYRRIGTTGSLVREHHGSIAKRDRQPGVAGGTDAEKKAWLSELHQTAMLFSWNIDSIVCSSRNWSKPTNCWCPRYAGRLDQ